MSALVTARNCQEAVFLQGLCHTCKSRKTLDGIGSPAMEDVLYDCTEGPPRGALRASPEE